MTNEELKGLAAKVLEDAYVMSLGTVDEGGVWVADVIHVHDEDLSLYWLSLPKARHSQAIEGNPKVACSVTAAWATDQERALQIEGVASRVEGNLPALEKRLDAKRGYADAEEGDALDGGHCWYVLRPTKVELIDSALFGFKKQAIELPSRDV
jgi:uncharacterized protein YhbP (UPF0306 family)